MKKVLIPVIILIIAVFIYGQYGFDKAISRDLGIYIYSGQMFAQGIPPYASIFDHKGPLTSILAGICVIISKSLGWNDIFTIRLFFFSLSCLTVVSIFLLGKYLFKSEKAGLFASLTFLAFFIYSRKAANGPHPKTLIVFFETLSILFTSKRKWFWAGFFGSLSFMTWQPTIIFPLATIFLAVCSPPREYRIRAILRTLIGICIPVFFIVLYFAWKTAFPEFMDGFILFNLSFLDRGAPFFSLDSFRQNSFRILECIFNKYSTMAFPIFAGFFIILSFYVWRAFVSRSFKKSITEGRFAPILVTFPVLIIWSMLDFQGGADFFIFLPYIAISFGAFLAFAIEYFEKAEIRPISNIIPKFLTIGLSAAFILLAIFQHSFKHWEITLECQLKSALEIEKRFGKNKKVVSIGVPQVLTLLHRSNPTPYVFIDNGIDRYIEEKVQGGFDGWIQELESYCPDIVFYEETSIKEENMEKLINWIKSKYREEKVGPWTIYVRNPV